MNDDDGRMREELRTFCWNSNSCKGGSRYECNRETEKEMNVVDQCDRWENRGRIQSQKTTGKERPREEERVCTSVMPATLKSVT